MKNKTRKDINELLEFGIINLDKPAGPTSFSVSDYVKKNLGLRKVSHLGTLDPPVSGVLPICLNRAARLATYLMKKDKTYVGIMRLHEDISEKQLKEEMKKSTGLIDQLPPLRSAVKRAVRERTVYSFTFIERNGKDVVFETCVEAGTYIRTLIHDLGKNLGGAHMLELRRTQAGIFTEKTSYTLYEVDNAIIAYKKGDETLLRKMVLPAEVVIKKALPVLNIKETHVQAIMRGKPIFVNDVLSMPKKENEYVGVFCGDDFIEIAKTVLKNDLVAVPDFVFN